MADDARQELAKALRRELGALLTLGEEALSDEDTHRLWLRETDAGRGLQRLLKVGARPGAQPPPAGLEHSRAAIRLRELIGVLETAREKTDAALGQYGASTQGVQMASCYRCVVVVPGTGTGVGVCETCSTLACENCGERDAKAADFVCGICDSTRLSKSATAAGGSKPASGAGTSARVYLSSQDFQQRHPRIALASAAHRAYYKRRIEALLATLRDTPFAADKDNRDLLADAFGVAAWSVGVEPERRAEPERLAHLSDPRLRHGLQHLDQDAR